MNFIQYETWKPDPGSTLVAKVLDIGTADAGFGTVTVANVIDETGKHRKVWVSAKVLATQWDQQRPLVGDTVVIRYDGKHPDKGYHRYSLDVRRNSASTHEPNCVVDNTNPTTARSDRDIAAAAFNRHRKQRQDNKPRTPDWVFYEDRLERQDLPTPTGPAEYTSPRKVARCNFEPPNQTTDKDSTEVIHFVCGEVDPFEWEDSPEPQESMPPLDNTPTLQTWRRRKR